MNIRALCNILRTNPLLKNTVLYSRTLNLLGWIKSTTHLTHSRDGPVFFYDTHPLWNIFLDIFGCYVQMFHYTYVSQPQSRLDYSSY